MNIKNSSDFRSLFFDNKSLKQIVFKNTFWLALSEGTTRILKLFLIIYVARILGATEYGKFTFALSFVSMLAIFSDLGLNSFTVREISRDKEKEKDFPHILSLKLILSFIAFILIFIGSFFITSSVEIQKVIWILGIYVLINNFSTIIYSFFQAKQRMEYESFARIIQGIIITSIGFFIILKFPSVQNLSFGYLFASLIALFLVCLLFHSKIYSLKLAFSLKKWESFLNTSWPIALSGIFAVVYNGIGSVVMGNYNQITQVGWYNASDKITNIISVLVSLASISFFPILSNSFKDSKEKFQSVWNNYFKLVIAVSIPLIVGGIVLAPKIIDLIYDPSYFPSILIFQILIVSVGCFFITTPFGQALFIFNQQKKVVWISLSFAIFSIILNIILIPIYSLYGVALIKTIAYILILLLLLKSTLNLTTIRFLNSKFIIFFIGVIIASFSMFSVILIPWIYNLHVLFVIIIGIIAYLTFLLVYNKLVYKFK